MAPKKAPVASLPEKKQEVKSHPAEKKAKPPAPKKKPAAKTVAEKVLDQKKAGKAKGAQQLVKASKITADALKEEIVGMDMEEMRELQAQRRVYSTGIVGLDCAIGKRDPIYGNGGVQELSILELYGPPGSCKSAMSFKLARNILEDDPENIVVFLFTEEQDGDIVRQALGKHNSKRVIILGCYNPANPDMKLQLAEQRLTDLIEASKYENVKLLVIDSLKALISAKSIFKDGDVAKGKDKPIDEDEMAVRARIMEKLFNHLIPKRKSAILCMLNHISERIPNIQDRFILGKSFRDKTTGGRLKEFYSLIRVHVDSEEIRDEKNYHPLEKNEEVLGMRIVLKVKKNRHGYHGRKCSVDFMYGKGFNTSKEVFHWAKHLGLIERAGAWYDFGGGNKFQGEAEAIKFLDENLEFQDELITQLILNNNKMFKAQPGQVALSDKGQAKLLTKDKDEEEEDDDEPDDEDEE